MTPLIITFVILGFLSMIIYISLMISFYTKQVRIHITDRYIPWYVWAVLSLSVVLFIVATILITMNHIKYGSNGKVCHVYPRKYYLQELV